MMNDVQELEFIFGPRVDDFDEATQNGEEGEEEEEEETKRFGKYLNWYDVYDKIRARNFIYTKSEDFNEGETQKEESLKTIISSSSGESGSIATPSARAKFDLDDVHPCLVDIDISDSQLKFSDIYSFNPIPEDPGIHRAFWTLYPEPRRYASNGVDKFFDMVSSMGLTPIESLRYQLYTDKVNLKFYGVDNKIIHPLCEALKKNKFVKSLDLQDTYLAEDSCYYLDQLLYKNTAITYLNLTACKIGAEGAARLENGLSSSASLIDLNLSRCDIGNDGFTFISRAIMANSLLKRLNISENGIDERSELQLKNMLVSNDSLEYLNLSWNSLSTKQTATSIFSGLLLNDTITEVDFSWCSMGKETVPSLCNYISNSEKVKRINLEGNRYIDLDLVPIAKALLKSKSLEELVLTRNPLNSVGITEFIKTLAVDGFSETAVKLVVFECLWASKEANPALEKLKEIKPGFFFKLGGILGNYKIDGPDLKELFFLTANHESMKQKKKKDRKDFGQFIMSLPDTVTKRDKFTEMVQEYGLKISDNLANEIVKLFLVTKKSFDPKAMKSSYLEYFPGTKIPEPPQPTADTEIETKEDIGKNGKNGKKGKKMKKDKIDSKKSKGKKKKK